MANLFTGARHALQYRKYRPTYPPEVYQTIVDYCKKGDNLFQAALDIGCGTGQSTLPLATHFKHVTGLDPSETQLREAEKCRNESNDSANLSVSFKTGTAEDLSEFQSDSIDLITFAQSFHWVDVKSLYNQAKRVLRPSGVLVAYGYGNVKVESEKANDVIWEFYRHTVGPYWDSRRHHIDNHLTEFSFPFSDFIRLCEVYGTDQPETSEVQATWPIFMLLGRHLANDPPAS